MRGRPVEKGRRVGRMHDGYGEYRAHAGSYRFRGIRIGAVPEQYDRLCTGRYRRTNYRAEISRVMYFMQYDEQRVVAYRLPRKGIGAGPDDRGEPRGTPPLGQPFEQ